MSLEEALNRNSDLLEKHNALLEQVLSKAGASKPADEGAASGKATRGKGKDKDDGAKGASGPSFDTLKADLAAWLGEFAKEEDKDNPEGAHPEVAARKEALAKAFGSDKLQIKKLPEIADDAAKIGVLHTWLHEKAKKVDKGFGVGRFVADPEPADEGEDDDMGV